MSFNLLTPRHCSGKVFFPHPSIILIHLICLWKLAVELAESKMKQSVQVPVTEGLGVQITTALCCQLPLQCFHCSHTCVLQSPSSHLSYPHLSFVSFLILCWLLFSSNQCPLCQTLPQNAICVVSFRPLMQSSWIAPYLLASELHLHVPPPETLQSSWQHNQSRSDLQPFPRKLKPLPQKQIVHSGRKHIFWVKEWKKKKKKKKRHFIFFFQYFWVIT